MTVNGKYLCDGCGEHFNIDELNEDGMCEICATEKYEREALMAHWADNFKESKYETQI